MIWEKRYPKCPIIVLVKPTFIWSTRYATLSYNASSSTNVLLHVLRNLIFALHMLVLGFNAVRIFVVVDGADCLKYWSWFYRVNIIWILPNIRQLVVVQFMKKYKGVHVSYFSYWPYINYFYTNLQKILLRFITICLAFL